MTKLWLLRPRKGLPKGGDPWEPWYDKCFGVVLEAMTEADARMMAHEEHGHDLNGAWLDANLSTCEEMIPDGEPGIIIADVYSA